MQNPYAPSKRVRSSQNLGAKIDSRSSESKQNHNAHLNLLQHQFSHNIQDILPNLSELLVDNATTQDVSVEDFIQGPEYLFIALNIGGKRFTK